jgi:predicted nucleic acid-binding protein
MSRRILDTSVLCRHWRVKRAKAKSFDLAAVQRWARELIDVRETDAVVTPVEIEFVAGAQSARELKLLQTFLACFKNLDQGRISPADWEKAREPAGRVPPDGTPRKLGDCLIYALAIRFRCEVDAHDEDFRILKRKSRRD